MVLYITHWNCRERQVACSPLCVQVRNVWSSLWTHQTKFFMRWKKHGSTVFSSQDLVGGWADQHTQSVKWGDIWTYQKKPAGNRQDNSWRFWESVLSKMYGESPAAQGYRNDVKWEMFSVGKPQEDTMGLQGMLIGFMKFREHMQPGYPGWFKVKKSLMLLSITPLLCNLNRKCKWRSWKKCWNKKTNVGHPSITTCTSTTLLHFEHMLLHFNSMMAVKVK